MKKCALILFVSSLFVVNNANGQSKLFEKRIVKTGAILGIVESTDDAEQENNNMDKLFDDDLDMGWEGDDFNILVTGLRFTNILIPQNAKIDSAFLVIFSHEEEKDPSTITISGDANANPSTFSLDTLITVRPKTKNQIVWEITELWPIWKQFKSPDLSRIVQEMLDNPKWVSGNAMAFILAGQDQGASSKDNARDFESFENEEDPADGGDGKNHPEKVPKLMIYYSLPTTNSELIEQNAFEIYPNPTQNTFNTSRMLDLNSNVTIMDLQGKIVKSFRVSTDANDVSDIKPGCYTVKAQRGGFIFTKKLIKH